MESCNNKDCVRHTPIVHNGTCATSGGDKCKDSLHLKECWTKEDIGLMGMILSREVKQIEKNETTLS
jgi:hypothetical protein